MANLPQPINGTEEYLKAIHQELVKLNTNLAGQASAAEPALADLKEPKAAARKKAT
jgi:hypothetical protein